MNRNDAINLVPSEPPGRSSRKARRFAPEMRALRAQGYTFEAIRLALASSGAYFSDRGRLFQADRGRRIGVAVEALGKRAGTGVNVS